ncbi:MAG: hypothetical protein KTQ49_03915 [Candidatus Omnitrophica bacterium]|nr:hypothetical protein [Candidatus Omnitrophota bacterium]
MNRYAVFSALVLGLWVGGMQTAGYAKTAREIDVSVDVALERFQSEISGGKDLLNKAKGVLVFPHIVKGGFVIGAEYGEGALRVEGKTVDYYNMISGSLGFQLGGQARRVFVLFLDEASLKMFRDDPDWLGAANASGVLGTWGAEGSMDTMKTNEPIMTFVLDQKGLMGNLNLEVGKINAIKKNK